eukprot:1233981-Rhodomonas_salina.1
MDCWSKGRKAGGQHTARNVRYRSSFGPSTRLNATVRSSQCATSTGRMAITALSPVQHPSRVWLHGRGRPAAQESV